MWESSLCYLNTVTRHNHMVEKTIRHEEGSGLGPKEDGYSRQFEWEWVPWAHIFRKLGPHSCLERIRRCGIVGGGVVWLEEVCYWWRVLEFHSLPAAYQSGCRTLSSSFSTMSAAYHHTPPWREWTKTSETVGQHQFNVSFIRFAVFTVSLHNGKPKTLVFTSLTTESSLYI